MFVSIGDVDVESQVKFKLAHDSYIATLRRFTTLLAELQDFVRKKEPTSR